MPEDYESSLSDLFEGETMEITEVDLSNLTSKDVDKIVETLGLEKEVHDEGLEDGYHVEAVEKMQLPDLNQLNSDTEEDTESSEVPSESLDYQENAEDVGDSLNVLEEQEIEDSQLPEVEDGSISSISEDIFMGERYYLVVGKVDGVLFGVLDYLFDNAGVSKVVVTGDDDKSLISLKRSYPNVSIVTGSLGDKFTVDKIWSWYNPAGVFYLPSFDKEMVEAEARNSLSEITVGCSNLLDICSDRDRSDVEFVIGLTGTSVGFGDSVYSSCMRINERMFEYHASINDKTFYRMVRSGEVLDSYGSKLKKWKEMVSSSEEITIPSKNDTMFISSTSGLVEDIMLCLQNGYERGYEDGVLPLFSENNKPVRVSDVIEVIGGMFGKGGSKVVIKEDGIHDVINRPSEYVSDIGISSEEVVDKGIIRDTL